MRSLCPKLMDFVQVLGHAGPPIPSDLTRCTRARTWRLLSSDRQQLSVRDLTTHGFQVTMTGVTLTALSPIPIGSWVSL